MDGPTATVIIVGYRVPDLVRRCLESLFDHHDPAELDVVVVDNAPGDGTAEIVTAEFPRVRLIEPGRNLGFGRACNLAAETALGDRIVLLNPDTVVRGPVVRELAALLEADPGVGIAGGRTVDDDGAVDPRSCWGEPTLWSAFCFATGLSTAFGGSRILDPESLGPWPRDSVREVGIVSGCLLATTRTVWRELGGFDTRFFMYGEDADLSMRARRLGYRPSITPHAVVTHDVGSSTDRRADKTVMVVRSKATLHRKHRRRFPAALAVTLLRAGTGLRALGESVSRQRKSRSGPSPNRGQWTEVWSRQPEWVSGYDLGAAETEEGAS